MSLLAVAVLVIGAGAYRDHSSDEQGDLKLDALDGSGTGEHVRGPSDQASSPSCPFLDQVAAREYSSVRDGGWDYRSSQLGVGGMAWQPGEYLEVDSWMLIDAGKIRSLIGVETQARAWPDQWTFQRANKFNVAISTDNITWVDMPGTFEGPLDSDHKDARIKAQFSSPVDARYLKIFPTEFGGNSGSFSMRAGLLLSGSCADLCSPAFEVVEKPSSEIQYCDQPKNEDYPHYGTNTWIAHIDSNMEEDCRQWCLDDTDCQALLIQHWPISQASLGTACYACNVSLSLKSPPRSNYVVTYQGYNPTPLCPCTANDTIAMNCPCLGQVPYVKEAVCSA